MKVAMDAACYAAASNMNWSADLAKQQPTGGIQVPFIHKKGKSTGESKKSLNHVLTVYKKGCDGCSLLCCCW